MELLRVIERYQDRLCGICITIIILNKCVTFVHVYFFCKLKYSVSVLSIQRYHRKRMPWVVSSSTRVNGTKREPVKWWQPLARLKATPHNRGTITYHSRICTHLRLVWFRKRDYHHVKPQHTALFVSGSPCACRWFGCIKRWRRFDTEQSQTHC